MNPNSFVDRIFQLFFDDEPAGGLGDVANIPHGQTGDLAILEQGAEEEEEDDVVPEGEEAETDEEDPETFDEGDEEEEETDDKEKVKDGEEEEVEEFKGRPTLTDIKKKYPKIFKEFPDLRDVLFREQEFGKHFGSVEEAENASVKAGSFDTIEAALLAGDSSPIIEQLGANAPDSLKLMVQNFLPAVLEKSQDLYLTAATPIIEQFIHTAYEHGKRVNDPNLMKSAQHAANFFFGKPDIPNPAGRRGPTGPHPAEMKLNEERQQFAQERFKEASSEISSGIDSELEADILKGFDVKGMTDRQRKAFMQNVKDEIDKSLGSDEAFKRSMAAMWKKAAAANYPKEQRASIKSAFLARAKALVPSVRTRLRGEWFGNAGNSVGKPGDKNKQGQQLAKKRTIPQSGGAASTKGTRPPSAKDVDFTKTTDLDLINGKFTRRK